MPPKSYPLRRQIKYAFGDTKFKRPSSAAGRKHRVKKTSSSVSSHSAKQSSFTMQNTGFAGVGGFPLRKYVTLRYAQQINLTPSVGGANHLFRLNSLYDPDYTGVGHQPLGYDQWTTIYDKYAVRRARIKITEVTDSTGSNTPCYTFIGIRHKPTGTPTSGEEAMENPDYSDFMLSGMNEGANGNPRKKVLVQEVDIVKFLNRGNIDDSDLLTTVSTNPVNEVYADINTLPINGNTAGTMHFVVEIEFDVIFQQPKALAQS